MNAIITDRIRIQNFIKQLVLYGKFYSVTYDVTTKLANPIDSITSIAHPAEVVVNETNSVFDDEPKEKRGGFIRRRAAWSFDAIVAFNTEVTTEPFEKSILEPTPVLEADPTAGLSRARIVLDKAFYKHPVQQNPSLGTQVIFAFRVILGRV